MAERRRRRASRDEILAQIETADRAPFKQLLADWLDAAPDTASIKAAARRSPDRYAQGAVIVAKLAGITTTDRLEVTAGDDLVRLAQRLVGASDMEFERMRLEYERTKALPSVRVVESAPSPPSTHEQREHLRRLRRSQRGVGVLQPVDIVTAPPASAPIRFGENRGAEHGSAPPPGA